MISIANSIIIPCEILGKVYKVLAMGLLTIS